MRIYLAGPMTGLPFHNREAFTHAANALRATGYAVVSPLEVYDAVHTATRGAGLRNVIAEELRELCFCDGVALLDGWEQSKGVRYEIQIAAYLGLQIQTLAGWLDGENFAKNQEAIPNSQRGAA